MPLLFSIIIPTYNRAHLIENTVTTVLKQEYPHFELIIVDDGSTDNTRDVVENIIKSNPSKTISYYLKPNGERAAARNYGLDMSRGEYITYFDSDDELYPNHLDEAARFIAGKPGVEIFHLRYDIKNRDKIKTSEGPKYKAPPNSELIKGNFLSCNGVILKKEIALANRFNEDRNLSAAEDWELWLRLSVQYPIYYINTITSTVINHVDRSVLAVNKERLITRMELMIKYASENKAITENYKYEMYKLKASCYSYISLHLALTKVYRKDSLRYLLKSIWINPGFIFQNRFFGILKNLL